MAIRFHSEDIQFELGGKRRHREWINASIELHNKIPGEISYIFTSNEQLRLMNREYLNHDQYTDVITFDYTQGKVIGGDIFISIDQVRINAVEYGCEHDEELRRVMIHGILHLIGYRDDTPDEKGKMREKENEALHLWLKMV